MNNYLRTKAVTYQRAVKGTGIKANGCKAAPPKKGSKLFELFNGEVRNPQALKPELFGITWG